MLTDFSSIYSSQLIQARRGFLGRALRKIINTETYITNFDSQILAKTYLVSLRGEGGILNAKSMINMIKEALAGGSPAHIAAIIEFLAAMKAIANLQLQRDIADEEFVVLEQNEGERMLPEDVRRAGRFVEWALNESNKIDLQVTAAIRRILLEYAENNPEKTARLEAIDVNLTAKNETRVPLARNYKAFRKGELELNPEHSHFYSIELLSWGPNDCAKALQRIVGTQCYVENFSFPILAEIFIKSLQKMQGNRGVHDSKKMIGTISQALHDSSPQHILAIMDFLMEIKQIAETSENVEDKRRADRFITWVLAYTDGIDKNQTEVIHKGVRYYAEITARCNKNLIELIASITDDTARNSLNQMLDSCLIRAIVINNNLEFLDTQNVQLRSRIFNNSFIPEKLLDVAENSNFPNKSFALALKIVRVLTAYPGDIADMWKSSTWWTRIANEHVAQPRTELNELLAFVGNLPRVVRNHIAPAAGVVERGDIEWDDLEVDGDADNNWQVWRDNISGAARRGDSPIHAVPKCQIGYNTLGDPDGSEPSHEATFIKNSFSKG